MKFNVACKSEAIDPVINEIGIALEGIINKALYESDVGENPIEITMIPVDVPNVAINVALPILKAIPGVIFIEPVREEVITYEFTD